MSKVVHKHKRHTVRYSYPGGSPTINAGTIDVNVCNEMSLSKGTYKDEEVTCPDCIAKKATSRKLDDNQL